MGWWSHRRLLLFPLLLVSAACLATAAFDNPSGWVTRSGLLLDIAGLLQLEVSAWLNSSLEVYGDEALYPNGPPSSFTRQEGIIDDPDTPIRNWIAHRLFGEPRLGLMLIIIGCALQLGATFL